MGSGLGLDSGVGLGLGMGKAQGLGFGLGLGLAPWTSSPLSTSSTSKRVSSGYVGTPKVPSSMGEVLPAYWRAQSRAVELTVPGSWSSLVGVVVHVRVRVRRG